MLEKRDLEELRSYSHENKVSGETLDTAEELLKEIEVDG